MTDFLSSVALSAAFERVALFGLVCLFSVAVEAYAVCLDDKVLKPVQQEVYQLTFRFPIVLTTISVSDSDIGVRSLSFGSSSS